MIRKCYGVVVLYFPDISECLENMATYRPFVEKLLIVCNSKIAEADRVLLMQDEAAILIENNENLGVASALNQAAIVAVNAGAEYLLTMDQDSLFTGDNAGLYFEQAVFLFEAQQALGIIGPEFSIEPISPKGNSQLKMVNAVITSGAVIRLSAWKAVGGFKDDLFIDEVDNEFCYRLQLNNYQVGQLTGIYLTHQLGIATKGKGYFGAVLKKERAYHKPERLYYIVRNYLYVRQKYKPYFKEAFAIRDKQLFHEIKNSLFFSGHFFKALRFLIKGYFDYKRNIRN